MIERYLQFLKARKGASPQTVEAYGRDLRQWRRDAIGPNGDEEDFDPLTVTTLDIRQWLANGGGRWNAATRKRKLQAVRSFYNYLLHEGLIERNPAAEIASPRLPQKLPTFVREGEMVTMLDGYRREAVESDEVSKERFVALRRSVVLELFYTTGMRCSEMVGLRDSDVNTHSRTIRVMGKRMKERIVPLMEHVAHLIDEFRDVRNAWLGPCPTLIPNMKGEPAARHQLYEIVHKAMDGAGVHASRRSPHVLRHSCATDLLNNGATIDSVRNLLGHASLATTQIYTHLSFRDLQNNYELAHPRAKKS